MGTLTKIEKYIFRCKDECDTIVCMIIGFAKRLL